MRVLGVVLAGGRSSRFGSDKALALYRGRTLLDLAIAALDPLVAEVALCGRAHRLRSIADRPVPDLGPLGGLNGALAVAAGEGFDAVLSVPCDVPELDTAALRPLLAGAGAAVFADLPVCGLWPVALASALDARLATGGSRSVAAFARDRGAVFLSGPGLAPGQTPGLTPGLTNVNTPDDLARIA